MKIEGAWRAVSLAVAAINYVRAVKRGPACHGRVMILDGYTWPTVRRNRPQRRSHTGCPLKPDTYTGTPSLHPLALA